MSGIDLRLGSCLAADGLPALAAAAVDCALLDPPYDARTHRAAVEGVRQEGRRRVSGALPFPPLGAEELRVVAGHLARVTKRWILVFAADRQLEAWAVALEGAGARFIRTGLALRDNPRPQLTGDRPGPPCDHLIIAHAAGTRLRWNGGGRAATWRAGAARHDPGGQVHPCQKPLGLVRALLEDFSDPGELVLDAYAGSGTTAVACRELGRRFLGWEVDPASHAVAEARVSFAREQLRLDVPRAAEQADLELP